MAGAVNAARPHQRREPGIIGKWRARREHANAGGVERSIRADRCLHEILLVDRGQQGLTQSLVVEGAIQMVEAQNAGQRQRVNRFNHHLAVAAEQQLHFRRRLFVPINLTGLYRGGGGRGIHNDVPFHAIKMRDFRPGGQAWRAGRHGHVIGEAFEHRQAAGIEFIGPEAEGAAADRFAHLLEGIGLGQAFGHDEGRAIGNLRQRMEQQREGFFQAEADPHVIHHLDVIGHCGQLLAEGAALHPALQAWHHILRAHGFPVMEFQPRAQRDGDTPPAIIAAMAGCHLRLRLELRIHAIERVEHHIPVIPGDIGRGPNGVEAGEVRLRHHFQHAVLRGLRNGEGRQRGCGCGGTQFENIPTLHVSPLFVFQLSDPLAPAYASSIWP